MIKFGRTCKASCIKGGSGNVSGNVGGTGGGGLRRLEEA